MSQTVAIIGAGRVGVASALLLFEHTDCDIAIIDVSEDALKSASVAVPSASTHLAGNVDLLEATLRSLNPAVVICSTPFHVNIKVAGICAKLNCHYIDFTEDVSVTKAVTDMHPNRSTFVLQTGLAPGLVNSVGLHLIDSIKADGALPHTLKMRVGALPAVGRFPEAYSLTWSSSGLINEYYQPVERIKGWKVIADEPLDDHEELLALNTRYEAFNTSGGMGAPKMYMDRNLMEVDYKTIRHPGHLDFLQKKLVAPLSGLEGLDRIKEGMRIVDGLFTYTRQDTVIMVVSACGTMPNGHVVEKSYARRWDSGELTALELTTAGTGVAVVELLLDDKLPKGIVFGGEVPYLSMLSTNCGSSFMDQGV